MRSTENRNLFDVAYKMCSAREGISCFRLHYSSFNGGSLTSLSFSFISDGKLL